MEYTTLDNLKKWWYVPLVVYLLPNVLMALFVIFFRILIVDEKLVVLTSSTYDIIFDLILVIISYFAVRFLCISFNKKAINYQVSKPSKYLGRIILASQVFQLFALLFLDYGRVGGRSEANGNIIIQFLSYLPIDILFLIYYSHVRAYKVAWLNLLLYLIVSVLQGWSGIWMILFFIEFFFFLKRTTFKSAVIKGALITIILLFFYPLITMMRNKVRGQVDVETRNTAEAASALMTRLQYTTNIVLIDQEQDQIREAIGKGEITPYYLDNRIGTISLFSNKSVSIQKYLTTNFLIDANLFSKGTDLDEFGWFTHVGIVGWLFLLPPLGSIIYLFFILIVTLLPFLINHYLLKSLDIIATLQTLTLGYVFHGWLSPQFTFIWGIIVYAVLFHFFSKSKKKEDNLL